MPYVLGVLYALERLSVRNFCAATRYALHIEMPAFGKFSEDSEMQGNTERDSSRRFRSPRTPEVCRCEQPSGDPGTSGKQLIRRKVEKQRERLTCTVGRLKLVRTGQERELLRSTCARRKVHPLGMSNHKLSRSGLWRGPRIRASSPSSQAVGWQGCYSVEVPGLVIELRRSGVFRVAVGKGTTNGGRGSQPRS